MTDMEHWLEVAEGLLTAQERGEGFRAFVVRGEEGVVLLLAVDKVGQKVLCLGCSLCRGLGGEGDAAINIEEVAIDGLDYVRGRRVCRGCGRLLD